MMTQLHRSALLSSLGLLGLSACTNITGTTVEITTDGISESLSAVSSSTGGGEEETAKQTAFIQHNHQLLAMDIARGHGERLQALAHLYRLPETEVLQRLRPHLDEMQQNTANAIRITHAALSS